MFRRFAHLSTDRCGTTAVEFALLAPLLFTILFGIVEFGKVISMINGMEQLVAEAARASIGGLSDTERDQLARASISAHVGSYAFIDATRVTVTTDEPSAGAFRVSASYDMSNALAYQLLGWLPFPPPVLTRAAIVQRGGF